MPFPNQERRKDSPEDAPVDGHGPENPEMPRDEEENITAMSCDVSKFMQDLYKKDSRFGYRVVRSEDGEKNKQPRAMPDMQQGGREIHPDLKSNVQFKFWSNHTIAEKEGEQGMMVVLMDIAGGDQESIPPWVGKLQNELGRYAFEDFTHAKQWLRQKAEKLSQEGLKAA